MLGWATSVHSVVGYVGKCIRCATICINYTSRCMVYGNIKNVRAMSEPSSSYFLNKESKFCILEKQVSNEDTR